jgi:hypothetical protein
LLPRSQPCRSRRRQSPAASSHEKAAIESRVDRSRDATGVRHFDKTSVDNTSIDKTSVDKTSVDKTSVDKSWGLLRTLRPGRFPMRGLIS